MGYNVERKGWAVHTSRPRRKKEKRCELQIVVFSEGSRLEKKISNPPRDLVYMPSRYKILPGIDMGIKNVIDSKQNTDSPPFTTWLQNLPIVSSGSKKSRFRAHSFSGIELLNV